MREYVVLASRVEQPYIEQERSRPAAENRMPPLGSAAHRGLSLIGVFQLTLPCYRPRSILGASAVLLSLLPLAPRPRRFVATETSLKSTQRGASWQYEARMARGAQTASSRAMRWCGLATLAATYS